MAAARAVILERSGVDDLILLDEVSEDAVLDVLKSRYLEENIYTYIGRCSETPRAQVAGPPPLVPAASNRRGMSWHVYPWAVFGAAGVGALGVPAWVRQALPFVWLACCRGAAARAAPFRM